VNALCVNVKGAALALGVGTSSVWRWIDEGLLPVIKFPSERFAGVSSRRVLIAVSDLEEFVKVHRVPATNSNIGQIKPLKERAGR
jgi:predicted DNA-binding transcriptional regulator AlpA